MKIFSLLILTTTLSFANNNINEEINLGKKLFFDTILSKNKTQSCATCHNPDYGFIDNRANKTKSAVSLGDDQKSLGNRNTPSIAYAKFSPEFHFKKNIAIGGQFLDGREKNLTNQAAMPILNPVEMNMANKVEVINRLENNPIYNQKFKQIYGNDIFNNKQRAYKKMSQSIATFEKTKFFNAFDSKYDRFLRGEYELTTMEDLGKSLFFSSNNTNCSNCHQLHSRSEVKKETFSNYEYHNIGVPRNKILDQEIDLGLFNHTKNSKDKGKFKTPTLRNIAITSPYMHNGVFKNLESVILFYDKYINKNNKNNPENNKPWQTAEVKDNINLQELKKGKKLTNKKIKALVAFLITLTDKKFENKIKDK